jgi:hypothetical protein
MNHMSLRSLSAFFVACAVFSAVSLAGSAQFPAGAAAAPASSDENAQSATPIRSPQLAAACYRAGHRCRIVDDCCSGLVCIGRSKGDTNYRCTPLR